MDERDRPVDDEGIAAQLFDNSDFGYHKVSIERPDRRRAKFTAEAIAPLRFDRILREPMEWAYSEWGDTLYDSGVLKEHAKTIVKWCDDNDIELSKKNREKLLKSAMWEKYKLQFDVATALMEKICLLYTSPSPRDKRQSRMPSSA